MLAETKSVNYKTMFSQTLPLKWIDWLLVGLDWWRWCYKLYLLVKMKDQMSKPFWVQNIWGFYEVIKMLYNPFSYLFTKIPTFHFLRSKCFSPYKVTAVIGWILILQIRRINYNQVFYLWTKYVSGRFRCKLIFWRG